MNTPTVGMSLGISRLAGVVDWSQIEETSNSDCFVTSVGEVSIADRLSVVKALQESGKYSSVVYDFTPVTRKLGATLSDALKSGISFVAIIAEKEWNTDRRIQIKNLQKDAVSIVQIPQ